MSFFHKKKQKMSQNVWATIMPFGPVTNILLAQNFFSDQPKAGPHFRHCPGRICPLSIMVALYF